MNSLGVYLLVSLFFVVATMFEFAIVLLFKQIPEWKALENVDGMKTKKQRGLKNRQISNEAKSSNESSFCSENMTSSKWNDKQDENVLLMSQKTSKYPDTHKIDIAALFAFSLLYLLFNLTYWLYV